MKRRAFAVEEQDAAQDVAGEYKEGERVGDRHAREELRPSLR